MGGLHPGAADATAARAARRKDFVESMVKTRVKLPEQVRSRERSQERDEKAEREERNSKVRKGPVNVKLKMLNRDAELGC